MSHIQNDTSLFYTPSGLPQQQLLDLNVNSLLLPQTLFGMSGFLMMSSINQFIAAQAPHALRGILIGLWYSFMGLSYDLAIGGVIGVAKATGKCVKTSSLASKCGIWYSSVFSHVSYSFNMRISGNTKMLHSKKKR